MTRQIGLFDAPQAAPAAALLVGSGRWSRQKAVAEALSALPPGCVVILGSAPGLDGMALRKARALGLDVEAYPDRPARVPGFPGLVRDFSRIGRLAAARAAGARVAVLAFPEPGSTCLQVMAAAAAHALPVVDCSRGALGPGVEVARAFAAADAAVI